MYQRDGTGDDIKPIDLRLSFLKPQGFKWLVESCCHIEKINCNLYSFIHNIHLLHYDVVLQMYL